MGRIAKLLWIVFVVWIVFFIILNEKWANQIDNKSDLSPSEYVNDSEILDSDNDSLAQNEEDYTKSQNVVDTNKSDTQTSRNDRKWNRTSISNGGSISEMLSSYAMSSDEATNEIAREIVDEKVVEEVINEIVNDVVQDEVDDIVYEDINSEGVNSDLDTVVNEFDASRYLNVYKSSWLVPLSLKKTVKVETNTDIKYDTEENPAVSIEENFEENTVEMDDINYKNQLKIYHWNLISFNLKHSKSNAKQFEIAQDNTWIEIWLSEDILGSLLAKEDIDVKTLESENDEFLQRVFQDTRDPDVLNTILKTYISEYQFSKAKKYIENLPEMYREQIEPWLNLMISFNSFSLSSKTIKDQLTSLVKWYSDLWKISQEDALWYQSIILLMQNDYDKFFELAWSFGSDEHKKLASKLQWYQEQIKNQKWMPEYYFDTLVSLELFNNGFFQPAKVLALASLQKNSNYILPYQVLAYANFLTNSRDTSIEYLKKLIELDLNNAEKYRFLMWIAYYRNEKYEQSVVMLSLIRDSKLHLDAQRYLINDYLQLNQNSKLIAIWNKLLWNENLVDSDFYTYFYEAFYRPYSLWEDFDIYKYDTQLADKMLQVCAMRLPDTQRVVCTYGSIWKDIAMWNFDNLERSLLKLVENYPQWYLYQALWEYYVKQWDLDKAKAYLLKAVQLSQKTSEKNQIKKLLQDVM